MTGQSFRSKAAARFGFVLFGLAVSPSLPAATVKVDIVNFAFVPDSVTINVGDTVIWTQKDFTAHTSTSDSGVWDSPLLSLGQTFSFTFSNAGTFPYHCAPHPFMIGTVTVMAAPSPPPASPLQLTKITPDGSGLTPEPTFTPRVILAARYEAKLAPFSSPQRCKGQARFPRCHRPPRARGRSR